MDFLDQEEKKQPEVSFHSSPKSEKQYSVCAESAAMIGLELELEQVKK